MEKSKIDFFTEAKRDNHKEIRARKLSEKFGQSICKMPAFLDFLLEQTDTIVSVKTMPREKIAIFVLDHHWCRGSPNVGMASVVGVYRNEKIESRSFTYKDEFDASKDDLSLEFDKVEIIDVTADTMKIRAIPSQEEYSPQELVFEV